MGRKPRRPDPRQGCRCGRQHGGGEPAVPRGTPDPILPDIARAAPAGRLVGIIADPQIVKLTRMGDLDMSQPASGAMAFLKKLRGNKGRTFGRVGRKADGDAAPPAKDPALDSRQGPGHARLVPVACSTGWAGPTTISTA
jgi:hypothetical protein